MNTNLDLGDEVHDYVTARNQEYVAPFVDDLVRHEVIFELVTEVDNNFWLLKREIRDVFCEEIFDGEVR